MAWQDYYYNFANAAPLPQRRSPMAYALSTPQPPPRPQQGGGIDPAQLAKLAAKLKGLGGGMTAAGAATSAGAPAMAGTGANVLYPGAAAVNQAVAGTAAGAPAMAGTGAAVGYPGGGAGMGGAATAGTAAAVIAMPFVMRELFGRGRDERVHRAFARFDAGEGEPAPMGTTMLTDSNLTFLKGDPGKLSRFRKVAADRGIRTQFFPNGVLYVEANPDNTRDILRLGETSNPSTDPLETLLRQ